MKNENQTTVPRIVKAMIWGIVIGTVTTVILTMFSTAVMVKMESILYPLIVPMGIVSVSMGAFAGGYIGARIHQNMGMMIGALCGLGIFGIMLGTGAVLGSGLGIVTLLRAVPPVIGGAIGGILGVNRRVN